MRHAPRCFVSDHLAGWRQPRHEREAAAPRFLPNVACLREPQLLPRRRATRTASEHTGQQLDSRLDRPQLRALQERSRGAGDYLRFQSRHG